MKDDVLKYWSMHLSLLRAVDLLGPFNVRAEAWISFIEGTKLPLERFCITQSPRFDLQCLEALHKRCRSSLVALRLKEISKLDDDWLNLVADFTNLASLDISRPARSVSDDALIALLAQIGDKLSHLDISGHEDLSDSILLQGVKLHATSLASFSASDLPLLTDEGVSRLFAAKLKPEASETLDVQMRDGEGDDTSSTEDAVMNEADDLGGLPEIDATCSLSPLEQVDLSRSPALGSRALAALLQHSGNTVLDLNINQWKDVDNETLLTVGPSAPHLTKINIGWCRNVDNFVVKALLDSCPNLKLILCSGCNRLTRDCPRKVRILFVCLVRLS
jgi:DNA repair protein RAD7